MREIYINMTPLKFFLVIAFLLERAALLVGDLSGDNLCHRRETYTVTMRVIVKEPVQVKSYTWCLKVPPRCTKYKVEMRDKFKIQTELRERVVDVCCAGYAPDRTETHCLPICSGCVHGVCASPDSCTCEPGYIGDNCEIECLEGLWGADCEQKCLCMNEAECHHVTGDCKCGEGWRGSVCDKPCPRGTFGDACTKECNCGAVENSTCHHITGECFILQDSTTLFPSTTVSSTTTVRPDGSSDSISETSNSENHNYYTTTSPNSDSHTVLPTRTSVSATENAPLPNTERHVLYFDKLTTVVPDTTTALTEVKTTTTILPITTTTVSSTVIFKPQESERTTMQNEIEDNILTKGSDSDNSEMSSSNDKGYEDQEFAPEATKSAVTPKEEVTTIPHNFQMPPNGIIVVSDGLLSDRKDVEEGEGESKDSKDSFWDLVSSVSVAGGVALALIVMAAVTLLVSHRRNKKKMAIVNSKTSSQRRRETEQLPPPPGPQMYNYTEDVSTLPLRHLFPDVTYQPSGVRPGSDGLQLKFGDVTTNNIGQPYSDMRAYLELQYDIPPSSLSSKTNSFQPGVDNNFQNGNEPEHLYDEIPCWRSNTTASTNTDTNTSTC